MEMKDDLEMDGSSFLAIGRQGYGFGSVELECQAFSNEWPGSNVASSSTNSMKIQMDGGEVWQRKSDALRSFPGELSQVQSVPVSQGEKRQNCNGLLQDCWNSMSCCSNDLDVAGSQLNRVGLFSEASLGLRSSVDMSEHCKALEIGPGISGLDFLQTGPDVTGENISSSCTADWLVGNASEEMPNNMGCWSTVAGSSALGVRVADANLPITCLEDSFGSEGKSTGELMANAGLHSPDIITENCSTMHRQSREVHEPFNRIMNDLCSTVKVENMFLRSGTADQSALDASVCSYAMAISENEKRESLLQADNLAFSPVEHTSTSMPGLEIGVRRSTCKRKLNSALVEESCSAGSEISMKRENNSARIDGRSGPSRPNLNVLSIPAFPDSGSSISATSVIQLRDDYNNDRTGIAGRENYLFESIKSNPGETLDLPGTSGGAQRTLNLQPGLWLEQSPSQLHSLFARNLRSMPLQQPQGSYSRRNSPAEKICELGRMGAGVTGASHEIGQARSILSPAASQSGNNTLLRGNVVLPSFEVPVRERAPTIFEGTRLRGSSSGRALGWVRGAPAERRLASHTPTSGGVSGVTARAASSSEANVHVGQVDGSLLNSRMATSSQLSVFLSNRQSAVGTDRDVPPAMNYTAPFGSSLDVPPAGIFAGPCSSMSQSSLFVGGQGEGVLGGPFHSVLGMPFCGLHMSLADGEQRQRLFSEILSALEHSRRSEQLSFEELIMLDPMFFYGGIDIHDQHGDMRLDVDNMSYEELLALEERIGDVNTGLKKESISKCLRESKYSSLDATVAAISEESDVKCCICQEEYVEEDELGRLDCGHGYHTVCISQWLSHKNQCPICKSTAYSS